MPKKKTPEASETSQQTQTSSAPIPSPSRKRQAAVIQPELAVEIEKCKQRISSIKALNKFAPLVEGMDNDALNALEKIIAARRESLEVVV